LQFIKIIAIAAGAGELVEAGIAIETSSAGYAVDTTLKVSSGAGGIACCVGNQ
jgi:3-hydroxy-3-methylglutaryl CoA synthase